MSECSIPCLAAVIPIFARAKERVIVEIECEVAVLGWRIPAIGSH